MYRRVAILLALFAVVAMGTRVWAQETSSITRAGAVALAIEGRRETHDRVQWYDKHMPPVALFSDINQKLWYAPYLEAGFEEGIITVNSTKRFRPGEMLTIAEALVLTARLRERMDPPPPPVLFAPGSGTDWSLRAVQVAVSYDLKIPFPFFPGSPITRDQFYALLESAGIERPRTIALSIDPKRGTYPPPAPVIVAQPVPVQTAAVSRPFVAQVAAPRPAISQPIPTQHPTVIATTQPNASAKSFAISMPTLGISDLTIIHPSDPFTSQGLLAPLKNGVGHLFSYPGKGGKILIYGHSSSYPWDVSPFTKIFRQINKLKVGDKVYVTNDGTMHVYQVTRHQTVPAKDVSAYQGEGEELILYTCWPPDSIQERYLVFAAPVETIALK